jgi:streptogramin lyase
MRGPMLGAYLHNGKLYTHSTGEKTLFEIDPKTGNRKALMKKSPKPQAWRHIQWDEKRGVFWISGKMNSAMVTAWAPGSKNVLITDKSCSGRDAWASWFPLCKEGPLATLTLNYGPMWLNKKTGTLLFGYDSIGIVEYEPETGNSINRSL